MFAHSVNDEGQGHSLVSHLTQVARLASSFAQYFDAGDAGRYAGLWHDLGKFSPAFQKYIGNPEGRRGPDHKTAGAIQAAETGLDFLAWIVAGHHGGLPSLPELKSRLHENRRSSPVLSALSTAETTIPSLGSPPSLSSMLPHFLQDANLGERDLKLRLELFIRMLFSALVDADFLDTERHFYPERAQVRGGAQTLDILWRRLETSQGELSGKKDDELNRLRHQVYLRCLEAAEQEPGVFRLTVPTGGGKTRSVMAFALKHALTHGLRRVIVAVPYSSITEQTAGVYREIFGEGAVLEHYSEAPWRVEDEDEPSSPHTWPRLASENWDAPIVVTTTVQLFESLFSNRPARCRKLHNIAGSVVVLDEVQTLPTELLRPILNVLRELVAHYWTSIVLCSATLPAFQQEVGSFALENAHEIVPHPEELFRALRGVEYDLSSVATPWPWSKVAEEMGRVESCMAVVNTKGDALALLEALDDPDALHLSTLLCGAHRRSILREVRRRLREGKACRLVSTQVVEAGVDLDFPMVLRAMGPLDRIVQAAGRCNREGLLPGKGRVVVFQPEGGGLPPGAYESGAQASMALLVQGNADLFSPELYRTYFQRFYGTQNLDTRNIQALRETLDFPEVAKRFRLIQDDTVSVVVRYEPELARIEALLKRLREDEEEPRKLLRQLQPYVVEVRRRNLEQMRRKGLATELRPDLYLWGGGYDGVRGLTDLAPEDLVV